MDTTFKYEKKIVAFLDILGFAKSVCKSENDENLCKKHKTRNPFQLSKSLGIIVLYELLGGIKGYCNRYCRQKFIHLNQKLDGQEMAFTCCHELGHALLYPRQNTPFLQKNTLYSIDKLETQANHFALSLLYSDYDVKPFLQRSITDAANFMNVPVHLAEYRMKMVESTLLEYY